VNKAILVLFIFSIFLTSCGTTHHFLPGRPLAKGETLVTVSWHYDFGRVHLIDIIPDANCYFGQKDNINFGVGIKLPMFISHLSAAKYWKQGSKNYFLSYVHMNQVMGVNDNPYFELGGGYSKKSGEFYHNYMIGISFGTGIAVPFTMLETPRYMDYRPRGHFFPTLKYSAIGRKGGYSISYYHRLTPIALDSYYSIAMSNNDTLCVIKREDIDSMSLVEEKKPITLGIS
jgi:hypothetical protein